MEEPLVCSGGSGCSCELDHNLRILRETPLAQGADIELLRLLAYLAKRMRLVDGEWLHRQGERSERAYFVVEGRLALSRRTDGEDVVLHEVGERTLLGSLALLADGRRCYSARAVGAVECLALDRESFRRVLARFPEAVPGLVERIARQASALHEILIGRAMDWGRRSREG